MTLTNENRFITRIKSALSVPARETRNFAALFPALIEEEACRLVEHINARKNHERQKLLEQLIEAGKPINLNVIPMADMATAKRSITDIIIKKKPEWGKEKHVAIWRHPLIEQLNLPQTLADKKIAIHPASYPENTPKTDGRQQVRDEIIASFIGITSADYCVAESATLVMKTRPDQARATSLLPSIHIAVIRMDQIIANLKELYTLLTQEPDFGSQGLTNCLTFISGPSKTADIEAVMVHGAHGPREMYLIVLTNKSQ